jgi:O-acetyl-ADP-ribose deacetylase (regulator of RNase III)
MKLILVDPNPKLCQEWERAFHIHPDGGGSTLPSDVSIHHGRFQDVSDADGLVTAGNSFGLMDGGVDLAVARAFPGVEQRVQRSIHDNYQGELNVGDATVCVIEDLSGRDGHLLIYAPTMRVPLSIVGTDAVYRAMWAALVLAEKFGVRRLLVPGLGTGAGRMSESEAARQMALAWRNFNRVPARIDWPTASRRHHEIAGDSCCRAPGTS